MPKADRTPNDRLRRERERHGWSGDDLAGQLRDVAERQGERAIPQVDPTTIYRWERGEQRPTPRYVRLLCAVFDRSAEELGLVDDGPERATLNELAQLLDTPPGVAIEDTERAVLRLRRMYSRTPPVQLALDIGDRLRQVDLLLRRPLTLGQHRDLLLGRGWLTLLLGTVYFDLRQRETAHAYRDLALHIAQDVGHAELEAWTWETPAWFALLSGQHRDAVAYAQASQRAAPEKFTVAVAARLQEGRAWARMGARSEALAALRAGGALIERIVPPPTLDDHYTFDPAKLDFYAATVYTWLGEWDLAERSARRVIAEFSDPAGPTYWPTRVGTTRMDLGIALAHRGEVDEAAAEAAQGFEGPFVRQSTIWRAAELDGILREHEDVREARDFRERYALVRDP
jgi:transcriptional regulator with XRE-family HTH domain